MQREWKVGSHRVRREAVDEVWVTYDGNVSVDEARQVVEVFREIAKEGTFHAVLQVSKANLTTEARNYLTEHVPPSWLRGLTYVGAGFAQKAMGKAVMLALLFAGKNLPFEMEFVDTDEQARARVKSARAFAA